MEGSIYVVRVNVGQQMKFEFEGALLSIDVNDGIFTFGECNEHYAPIKDGDIIVLDFKHKSVAFNSRHFSMAMDIITNKKTGDNYYFKCVTDLYRVDVYICEKSIWREKGESIFS